tara:strand:+ start:62 stop:409 length:348 start_codon:yes stop_codon:yes gene_type:complete
MNKEQELYEKARSLVNSIASHEAPSLPEYSRMHKEANEIRSAFSNLENKYEFIELFDLDNTEGLTQEECYELNVEFSQKWASGDYDHLKKISPNESDDFLRRWAMKEFCDEVARR